jgi:hypothetical protein
MQPTPGGVNNTTGNGGCGIVPPNKSFARIPDGVGPWVDPIPTPGEQNKEDITTTPSLVTESNTPAIVTPSLVSEIVSSPLVPEISVVGDVVVTEPVQEILATPASEPEILSVMDSVVLREETTIPPPEEVTLPSN